MICENCENQHSGEYGSGRFCSSKCARGYSTKHKRAEINEKVSRKLLGKTPNRTEAGKQSVSEYNKKRWENFRSNIPVLSFDTLGWMSKRKRVIDEQHGCCNHCGINEWMGNPITLEIEHINGINDDNRRENLEALCPNCHSQTDTWRGRNKPTTNGKKIVSDDELYSALITENSIRQALLKVGLAAKGTNYKRAKRLLTKTVNK